jgi:hypothetical protein
VVIITNADSWDMLPWGQAKVACFKRSCFLHQGRSTNLTIRNTYTRSGWLHKLWQPHFRRQLRQELCLNLSSQMYGSNSAHCLKEHTAFSVFNLGTNCLLGNPLIHSQNKIFFTHLMASYLCSSNYNMSLSL